MTTLTSPQAKPKLPNGPKVPFFIKIIRILTDQLGMLEKFQQKYGDIFYTSKSFLYPPYVVFSNPQAIEKVFTADPNLFEVSQQTFAIRVLLGDNSLVLLDGIKHKQHRKLLMPPFHGERMKSYGETMVNVTKKVISQWQVGEGLVRPVKLFVFAIIPKKFLCKLF